MNKYKLFYIAMLLILTADITGCVEKMPQQTQTNVVEIANFSFKPDSINVSQGTMVTWVNNDPVEHTVTSSDGTFSSGNMATGGRFNFTFSKPGKYQYQCSIHPSMVGYVIVAVASGQKDAGKVNSTDPGPADMKNAGDNMANQSGPVVGLKLIASGFAAPMEFISSKDGRMFVVDQIGLIKVITADGKLQEEPFLNISDRMVKISQRYDERGLLGLAFHPDFARNGRVFVFYSAPLRSGAPQGWNCTNNLSEFRVSKDNPNMIDMNSEKVLLHIDKPQMNHNGGTIAFGPDGYLYLPLGDGGGANDVGMGHVAGGNAQNTSTLLGKIVRIDVDANNAGAAYGIPSDNPFINEKGFLPEIWAYGLRNPYRISFDSAGRLFVADAGQNLWEEVDLVTKGGNYGWNIREGTHCFDPNSPKESPASCPDAGRKGEPLLGPIIEYDHNNRTVVVGGYVYDGKALMSLAGSYVFADWSSSFAKPDGKLYMANPAGEGLWNMEEIRVTDRPGGRINEYIRSFGQDDEGEIYVLTSEVGGPAGDTGKIYRMVPPAK